MQPASAASAAAAANNFRFFIVLSSFCFFINEGLRREINLLDTPATGLHEKVLLYWYQARGDLKSRTGDRAIIESISSSSVKTICANEMIKSQMILNNENPFKEAFVVDVIVETIKGKPALYKVVALHDKLEQAS